MMVSVGRHSPNGQHDQHVWDILGRMIAICQHSNDCLNTELLRVLSDGGVHNHQVLITTGAGLQIW